PVSGERGRGEGVPRAQVVCIHGIQSHAGWYERSCSHLSRAGFEVFFLDRRGAGMNEQDRGDAPSFRRLLDDLAEFLRGVRGQGSGVSKEGSSLSPDPWPLTPVFLMAISWGGKLAAALQRRHPGLVDGLALLCPGFYPRVAPPLGQRLAIAWSRLTRPRRLFPIPLNDPELFTATPHWQQFIRDDPLSLRQATARLLIESVRLDAYLKVVPGHVRVPVLLMLAGRDRIIANAPTRRYVERFASADKEIIEYPEAHHTLEFEPEPERIFADLQRWLEKHCLPVRSP
ncbi:MAG TPA: alpha/beta fold hydrolase, partial [Gemmataceae bacterium]|nr:alpha/beta fold hydrolase [Gemmataceae bacterium]